MKALLCWQLNHIEISGPGVFDVPTPGGGTIQLCSDPERIQRLLSDHFRQAIGRHDTDDLLFNPILYSFDTVPEESAKSIEQFLALSFILMRQQVFSLWLSGDGAVDTKAFYAEVTADPEPQVMKTWGAMILSDSRGQRTPITLSQQNVIRAAKLYIEKVYPLLTVERELIDVAFLGGITKSHVHAPRVLSQKGLSRFARFWSFIMTARGTSDLGMKVANYCTALESLFTTESSELTHKIAERVACFLASEPKGRKLLFRDIKKAYSLRSKVVHGDVIGPADVKLIAETTTKLDSYLREIALKIINDENIQQKFCSKDTSILTSYFEDLVFGR